MKEEEIVIRVTIFLSVVALLCMYKISMNTKLNSELDRFTGKLPVVTGIFVALGVYLTYSVLKMTIIQMHVSATIQSVDRGWLNLTKETARLYSACPNLIDSFLFPWQRKGLETQQKGYAKTSDDFTSAFYLSTIIFQSWEDFFTTATLDESEAGAWLGCFLLYARSPQLKKYWMSQRLSYAGSTQEFGNLLFHYAITYPPNNEKELNDQIQLIVKDPIYVRLTSGLQ